jgi:hypothetical protein
MFEMGKNNVVLLDDRPDFALLYGLNLHLYVGAKIISHYSLGECIHYIKQNSDDISLIVSRSGKENMAEDVAKFLREINRPIPIVAIPDERQQENGLVVAIDRKKQLNNVIKAAAQSLNITAPQMAKESVPDFYPLPIECFRENLVVPCETYRKTGENAYKQFHHKGDKVLSHEIQDCREQGCEFLFIPKESRLQFVDGMTSQLISIINDQNLRPSEVVKFTAAAQSLVHNQAIGLGIDLETITLAEASIGRMKEISLSTPTIDVLLKLLLSQELSYRFKHSHLVTYICFHIVKVTQMKNSKEQGDKLAMAAFYQDLALTTDDMARLKSDEEILKSQLSDKDKSTVQKHALIAATLLSKCDLIPGDVVTIVKQHHGHRLGTSLSEKQAQIAPLAALYAVAEHWAHLVIQYEDKPIKLSQAKVLKHFQSIYDKPVFAKFLTALESLKI